MDVMGKPTQTSIENIVQPQVMCKDLEKIWIGLGAALEWIALRGQPISALLYGVREDDAAEKLVAVLADLPSEIAEALVRGAEEAAEGSLVSVSSGIWRQTATSDVNDTGEPYRLIRTDVDCEWDGAILGLNVSGYRRVQIRTDFIRDNWPEHERDIEPSPVPHVIVALAEVRRLIEKVIASTPDDFVPLTQREVVDLVRRCMPAVPRDLIRQIYRELKPTSKPGPKGRRNPDRKLRVQELGEKLIAAQLHN